LEGDCFGSLSNLVILDLHQNQLASFGSVPRSQVLDTLSLAFNQLTEVENLMNAAESLTVLDLHNNKLVHLPDATCDLIRLKTLRVSNNDLSDLPPRLSMLADLVRINIEGNPLRGIKSSMRMANAEQLKKYLRMRLAESDV